MIDKIIEIWYNGERVSMKWVSENYGTMYTESLKSEIKECNPYTTIYDESEMLEVHVY